MASRRWPTLLEWITIYLRALLRASPKICKARIVAGLTDEKFLSIRKEAKVHWMKPLEDFDEVDPVPGFMERCLEEADKELGPLPSAPARRSQSQTPPNDPPPLPAPPQ